MVIIISNNVESFSIALTRPLQTAIALLTDSHPCLASNSLLSLSTTCQDSSLIRVLSVPGPLVQVRNNFRKLGNVLRSLEYKGKCNFALDSGAGALIAA